MAVLEVMENEFTERDYSIPREETIEIKIENLGVEFPDPSGGEEVVALWNVNLEINASTGNCRFAKNNFWKHNGQRTKSERNQTAKKVWHRIPVTGSL